MGPKFTILPFPGVAHTTYPLSSTLEPLGLKYSLSLSLSVSHTTPVVSLLDLICKE